MREMQICPKCGKPTFNGIYCFACTYKPGDEKKETPTEAKKTQSEGDVIKANRRINSTRDKKQSQQPARAENVSDINTQNTTQKTRQTATQTQDHQRVQQPQTQDRRQTQQLQSQNTNTMRVNQETGAETQQNAIPQGYPYGYGYPNQPAYMRQPTNQNGWYGNGYPVPPQQEMDPAYNGQMPYNPYVPWPGMPYGYNPQMIPNQDVPNTAPAGYYQQPMVDNYPPQPNVSTPQYPYPSENTNPIVDEEENNYDTNDYEYENDEPEEFDEESEVDNTQDPRSDKVVNKMDFARIKAAGSGHHESPIKPPSQEDLDRFSDSEDEYNNNRFEQDDNDNYDDIEDEKENTPEFVNKSLSSSNDYSEDDLFAESNEIEDSFEAQAKPESAAERLAEKAKNKVKPSKGKFSIKLPIGEKSEDTGKAVIQEFDNEDDIFAAMTSDDVDKTAPKSKKRLKDKRQKQSQDEKDALDVADSIESDFSAYNPNYDKYYDDVKMVYPSTRDRITAADILKVVGVIVAVIFFLVVMIFVI